MKKNLLNKKNPGFRTVFCAIGKALAVIFCIVFSATFIFAMNVDVEANTKNLRVFEKLELTFSGDFTYSNPYDFDDINIKAFFRGPSKETVEVDGFYMKDFWKTNGSKALPDNIN